MLLAAYITAFQLCWFGSSAAYLCSKQQQLLPAPISKLTAWAMFIATFVVASLLLTLTYHWLAALCVALVVVMSSWISIVLVAAYIPQLRTVIVGGSALILLTSLIGGLNAQ